MAVNPPNREVVKEAVGQWLYGLHHAALQYLLTGEIKVEHTLDTYASQLLRLFKLKPTAVLELWLPSLPVGRYFQECRVLCRVYKGDMTVEYAVLLPNGECAREFNSSFHLVQWYAAAVLQLKPGDVQVRQFEGDIKASWLRPADRPIS